MGGGLPENSCTWGPAIMGRRLGDRQGRLPGGGVIRVFKPEWEGVYLGVLGGETHLRQGEQNTHTDYVTSHSSQNRPPKYAAVCIFGSCRN